MNIYNAYDVTAFAMAIYITECNENAHGRVPIEWVNLPTSSKVHFVDKAEKLLERYTAIAAGRAVE